MDIAPSKTRRRRAPFEPSAAQREMVRGWAAFGVPEEGMARHLGIGIKTLQRVFKIELREAVTDANARVGQALYKLAIGGNPQVAMMWARTRMGWVPASTEPPAPPKPGKAKHDEDEVERMLREATDMVSLTRAREFAAHHRWKATLPPPPDPEREQNAVQSHAERVQALLREMKVKTDGADGIA